MWVVKTCEGRCPHCDRKFKFKTPAFKVTCPHCRWGWIQGCLTVTYVKPFHKDWVQVEPGLLFVGKDEPCR
jgi:hypothetical protein